jgi:hypothetical protein
VPSKRKPDPEPREVPPFVIIAAIAVLVLALGAGGWYVFNGGWKTAGQQDEAYKHELLPIIAAKHGDSAPLEAENALRRQQGQAPLVIPKDKKEHSQNSAEKLSELQRRFGAR